MTFLPEIPSVRGWFIISIAALLLALWRNRYCLALSLSTLSFLWGCWHAQQLLVLTEQYSDETVIVTGIVQTIDMGEKSGRLILFTVHTVAGKEVTEFNILLNRWSEEIILAAGQRWQLVVALRPVHSRLNQGGFDRQRWAVSNRQVLTGRVKRAVLLNEKINTRQHYIQSILPQIGAQQYRDILIALAFGERTELDEQRRLLLQETGIAHLMAISGLHISLSALFGWVIARLIQYLFPIRWLTPWFPLLIGWCSSVGYIWLSGANLPALRAGLTVTIWLYLRYCGALCSNWQVWLRVVALLLLLDPLSVLSDSLWLSCSAVAALIFWYQWLPLPKHFAHHWRWVIVRWLHLQVGIFLLLAPLQLLLFHGVSFGSLFANCWAVPLVSFITIPLILTALLLCWAPLLAETLWVWADITLRIMFYPLPYFASAWVWLDEALLIMTALSWLFIPAYRLFWWQSSPVSLFSLLCLALLPNWRTENELWRMTMLDVGHGLAVLIERQGKAILYDTGNAWAGGSMAKFEILPYLRWRGLKLEQIIISHQHQDHIGGLADLLTAYPNITVRTPSLSTGNASCQNGEKWQWKGLTLQALWPLKRVKLAGNAHSCVLLISDGQWSLLLTGDLEKQQEQQLAAMLRSRLQVDVLQVPHHGSNTSSTDVFLRMVKPKIALASVARYNPWRLPAERVVARYGQRGVAWRDTARSGQISVLFFSNKWRLMSFRQQISPRWYHHWFGSGEDNR